MRLVKHMKTNLDLHAFGEAYENKYSNAYSTQ